MSTHEYAAGDRCTCWVDEKYWFTWMGHTEPGSQKDWDPTCPEHGRVRVSRQWGTGYPWRVYVPRDGTYAFTGWVTAITFADRVSRSAA